MFWVFSILMILMCVKLCVVLLFRVNLICMGCVVGCVVGGSMVVVGVVGVLVLLDEKFVMV